MIWATRGAVVIGFGVLLHHLILWWPGLKALRKDPVGHLAPLLPFALAWAYGALGALSVMGLIGWAFDTALWASNWLGDAALRLGVGTAAGVSSRGEYLPLTDDGSALVVLLTIVLVALMKRRGEIGTDVKLGMWSGLCLGTSSSVAGVLAVPLAQGANATGTLVFSWIG